MRPGRSLILFPTAVAAAWTIVVAVFVVVAVVSDTEEGASWGEGFGAVAGNFAAAWLIAFVVSATFRYRQRH